MLRNSSIPNLLHTTQVAAVAFDNFVGLGARGPFRALSRKPAGDI
jgi:hypothetical protein